MCHTLNDTVKMITAEYNSFCDEPTGDKITGHLPYVSEVCKNTKSQINALQYVVSANVA